MYFYLFFILNENLLKLNEKYYFLLMQFLFKYIYELKKYVFCITFLISYLLYFYPLFVIFQNVIDMVIFLSIN